jgi:hypothetical protein
VAARRCQVVRPTEGQVLNWALDYHGLALRSRPHVATANAVVSETTSHSRQRRRITMR